MNVSTLQREHLHRDFDELHKRYGDGSLCSVYGAGQIVEPKYFFVFMNPTGRNVSADPNWKGIRAPWLGTKQIWGLFLATGLLSPEIYEVIIGLKTSDWTVAFAQELYADLANHSVYITNLAKCTQRDARPLSNLVFREYMESFHNEVDAIKPLNLITLGNQVSSIVLRKQISVSEYLSGITEVMFTKSGHQSLVHPTYYPVGQGRRNMPLSVERIKSLSDAARKNTPRELET